MDDDVASFAGQYHCLLRWRLSRPTKLALTLWRSPVLLRRGEEEAGICSGSGERWRERRSDHHQGRQSLLGARRIGVYIEMHQGATM